MGERKVLNKYIPHDFDPRLVPRTKRPKGELIPVRMMLPFSIQCENCSTFLYRGRKFNSKKEPCRGQSGKYLGIQRYRFFIKCTACSRPLTFLTDPKNADYEMESGGTRNYEVHKDKDKTEEKNLAGKAAEEKEDPMKALENRVLASAREMEDLDNLDEIKAMNMRHLKMMSGKSSQGVEGTFTILHGSNQTETEKSIKENIEQINDEDEAIIKEIKFGIKKSLPKTKESIIRLSDADEEKFIKEKELEESLLKKQQQEIIKKVQTRKNTQSHINPMLKIKRRIEKKDKPVMNEKIKSSNEGKKDKIKDDTGGNALSCMLDGYSSDSE